MGTKNFNIFTKSFYILLFCLIIQILQSEAATIPALENGQWICKGRKNGEQIANPLECNSYYVCNQQAISLMMCDENLSYDAKRKICNWPLAANCTLGVYPKYWDLPKPKIVIVKHESDKQTKLENEIEDVTKLVEKHTDDDRSTTRQPTTLRSTKTTWHCNTSPGTTAPTTTVDLVIPKNSTIGSIDKNGKKINPMNSYDPINVQCLHGGVYFLPHPAKCHKYFICANHVLYMHSCGIGSLWNFKAERCDYELFAKCFNERLDNKLQKEKFEKIVDNQIEDDSESSEVLQYEEIIEDKSDIVDKPTKVSEEEHPIVVSENIFKKEVIPEVADKTKDEIVEKKPVVVFKKPTKSSNEEQTKIVSQNFLKNELNPEVADKIEEVIVDDVDDEVVETSDVLKNDEIVEKEHDYLSKKPTKSSEEEQTKIVSQNFLKKELIPEVANKIEEVIADVLKNDEIVEKEHDFVSKKPTKGSEQEHSKFVSQESTKKEMNLEVIDKTEAASIEEIHEDLKNEDNLTKLSVNALNEEPPQRVTKQNSKDKQVDKKVTITKSEEKKVPEILATLKPVKIEEIKPDCKTVQHHFMPHPTDCNQYYICIGGEANLFSCPKGLWWDEVEEFCGSPAFTLCKAEQKKIFDLMVNH